MPACPRLRSRCWSSAPARLASTSLASRSGVREGFHPSLGEFTPPLAVASYARRRVRPRHIEVVSVCGRLDDCPSPSSLVRERATVGALFLIPAQGDKECSVAVADPDPGGGCQWEGACPLHVWSPAGGIFPQRNVRAGEIDTQHRGQKTGGRATWAGPGRALTCTNSA